MDVALLAKDLAVFLTPFLPFLIKAGEKAVEAAGSKLGGDLWEHAKRLWGMLHPRVEDRPAAQEAVADVVNEPENEDAQAALRQQLKKVLTEDEGLAQQIAAQWAAAQAAGVKIVASGERAVAANNISNSTVVTGDQNTVQSGRYIITIEKASGVAIGDNARVQRGLERAGEG
jgi:hypothetical protein